MFPKPEIVWRIVDSKSGECVGSPQNVLGVYSSEDRAAAGLTALVKAYAREGITDEAMLRQRFEVKPYKLYPARDYVRPYGKY